jgi:putative SOS response-associated peptidase YedK
MENGLREVGEMRWGFKLPDRLLFNARSEGIAIAKFWKEMLDKRRCIIPAGSFFEWKKTASGPKPKYKLSIKGRHILGMAGEGRKKGMVRDSFLEDVNGCDDHMIS